MSVLGGEPQVHHDRDGEAAAGSVVDPDHQDPETRQADDRGGNVEHQVIGDPVGRGPKVSAK
jgi:hypothetical protein